MRLIKFLSVSAEFGAKKRHKKKQTSAAVKYIDIADILGQKYRYRINISHGDIDPSVVHMYSCILKINSADSCNGVVECCENAYFFTEE